MAPEELLRAGARDGTTELDLMKAEIYAVLTDRVARRDDAAKLRQIGRIIARESVQPRRAES